MLQTFTHYFLHFVAIGAIAYFFDPKRWKFYWLVLIATMAVDADHLLATPIFEPSRCSIGFHPLHSFYAIPIYILGAIFIKKPLLRIICIGLIFHMMTDFLDCFLSDTHNNIRYFVINSVTRDFPASFSML